MHRSLIVCDVEHVVKSIKLIPKPDCRSRSLIAPATMCNKKPWEKCASLQFFFLSIQQFSIALESTCVPVGPSIHALVIQFYQRFCCLAHRWQPFQRTHAIDLHQTSDGADTLCNSFIIGSLWYAAAQSGDNDIIAARISFSARNAYEYISFGILVWNAATFCSASAPFSLSLFHPLWFYVSSFCRSSRCMAAVWDRLLIEFDNTKINAKNSRRFEWATCVFFFFGKFAVNEKRKYTLRAYKLRSSRHRSHRVHGAGHRKCVRSVWLNPVRRLLWKGVQKFEWRKW